MQLARLAGTVTTTHCHPSMKGKKLAITLPLNAEGKMTSEATIAYDPLGAAHGQRIIVTSDGNATRDRVNDPHSPLRNMVIGLCDT